MNNFKWNNFILPLEGVLLTEQTIEYFLNEFAKSLSSTESSIGTSSGEKKDMYAFIFKLEFTDNTIRSITDLLFFQFIINNDNKLNIKYLNELLLGYWSLRSDYYHLKPIKKLNNYI